MDYLANLKITPKTLRLIAEIDEFKGQWQALGQLVPDRLSALKKIATIESIGSSTRIEGVRLTDAEIERLLSGLQIHSFRSRDEQEVAGYAELMEMIFSSWKEISLTENHIRQLHGVLLKRSAKDERHRGSYKKLPNHVEAFDESGKSLGTIFETASPFDTPRMMETLVAWANIELEAGDYHPLLVISAFVARFLAIHPFQDGNGRLSRALTTLLLMRSGYIYVPYSSMERVIEDNKDSYYFFLRRAQSNPDVEESKLHEWVEFFLECMATQKNALRKKAERERIMGSLPPLSEQLTQLAREHGRVTVAGAEKLTGANRNTIKFHLKKLVEAEHLKQRGTGRGTWYEWH
ncbi:MAG: Fic family protein [bacterium]